MMTKKLTHTIGYLVKMRRPFEKIKLSQLYILCNILAEAEIRNVSIIKRKYLEKGLSFDETLSLLEDLKLVRINSGELIPSNSLLNTHNSLDDFKKLFLSVLFSASGLVSEELRNFLLNFQTKNGKIVFYASELKKIKFSDIRNLLLELEFISVSSDNATYIVNPNFVDLFVMQFSSQILSPESLKKKQTENESIGLSAEKAIIDFEIKRLSAISVLKNEIEHTSLHNVLAGYDIKSFEDYLDSNSKRIERYIEVKAVSVDNYKFYWSRMEIEITKVFGEKYYLYLLPVISNNNFDFEKLIIIRNPFENVFSNVREWKKEEECITFTKIQTNN